MCGDYYCPSCGPAQGNFYCPYCKTWSADGGCPNPEECQKRAKEEEEAYYQELITCPACGVKDEKHDQKACVAKALGWSRR
jgi:hypothetical protein